MRTRDDFDEIREALRRDHHQLTLEQLAAFWVRKNREAIIKAAWEVLQQPARTPIRIEPLMFAFADDQSKLAYQLSVGEAAARAVRRKKLPRGSERDKAEAHARIRIHVRRFTTFLKQRLMKRFGEITDETDVYCTLTATPTAEEQHKAP